MPYLGLRADDTSVQPFDCHPDETVICPKCNSKMGVREGHYKNGKYIPSHFFHYRNPDGCAGESATHYRMKSIAAEQLDEMFPSATVQTEQQIGDSSYIGDVVLTFPVPVKPYGRGIVVEAQYENKDKNKGEVTRAYWDEGFSLYWAYLTDYSDQHLEFEKDRLLTVWPNSLPDRSGLEGYSETVRALYSGKLGTKSEIDIVVPAPFLQDFAYDILSPEIARTTEHWKADTIWFAQSDSKSSWFNYWIRSDHYHFLEFWMKSQSTGEVDHTALSLHPWDREPVLRFCGRAQEYEPKRARDIDSFEVLTEIYIQGSTPPTGRFAIQDLPDVGRVFCVEKAGRNGTTRSFTVPWPSDGGDRLRALTTVVAQRLEELASGIDY